MWTRVSIVSPFLLEFVKDWNKEMSPKNVHLVAFNLLIKPDHQIIEYNTDKITAAAFLWTSLNSQSFWNEQSVSLPVFKSIKLRRIMQTKLILNALSIVKRNYHCIWHMYVRAAPGAVWPTGNTSNILVLIISFSETK